MANQLGARVGLGIAQSALGGLSYREVRAARIAPSGSTLNNLVQVGISNRIGRRASAGVWIGETSLYPHARRVTGVSGVGHDIAITSRPVPEHASNARLNTQIGTNPTNRICREKARRV